MQLLDGQQQPFGAASFPAVGGWLAASVGRACCKDRVCTVITLVVVKAECQMTRNCTHVWFCADVLSDALVGEVLVECMWIAVHVQYFSIVNSLRQLLVQLVQQESDLYVQQALWHLQRQKWLPCHMACPTHPSLQPFS